MTLNQSRILEILKDVDLGSLYIDALFMVRPNGGGFLMQLVYREDDIETGEKNSVQHARKWYISTYATDSEIIQTAFKAVMTSLEHRAREHFTYKGERIMSPHFDVEERVAFCKSTKFDKRSA